MGSIAYLLLGGLMGAISASGLFATTSETPGLDPAKLAPQMYRVIFDNPRYRVLDYHLQPGGKEPMHSHPNGVLVYLLTDAKVRTTFPDGRKTESATKAGDVVWRDPVTHRGENIGSNEIHELLVEPKTRCQ